MENVTQTLYKVLVDGKSCHGGDATWSLPNDGKPGKWLRAKGELEICRNGIHLTTEPTRWLAINCRIYEAEAKAIADWDNDKCVCRAARLLREVERPAWWRTVEKFVLEEIATIPWYKNSGEIKVPHRRYAARDAARDAAHYAAHCAARGAARGAAHCAAYDAAYDAARAAARDAAYAAAYDASPYAAYDAAYAAAYDASPYAAYDAFPYAAYNAACAAAHAAALQCCMTTVCADLDIAPEHRDYARDAWSIWQAGFGCFGKIGGKFIVFDRPR